MKDRSLFRLVAVRYLDEYKEMIEKAGRNEYIVSTVNDLNALGIYSIDLPLEFEHIFHCSIDMDVMMDEKRNETVLKEIIIDWERIAVLLKEFFGSGIQVRLKNNQDKAKFLKHEKTRFVSIARMANLIVSLLKEVWPIILKYFPLKDYGLPSRYLLEALMNDVLGEAVEIQNQDPHVYDNNDVYSLLLKKENEFLKEQLQELGVDVNALMKKNLFYERMVMLKQMLEKNPVYNVIISPGTNTVKFRNTVPTLIDSIDKLNESLKKEFFDTSTKYETVVKSAERYMDMRFNKKFNYSKIADMLGIDQNTVNKEIKELAKATGLEQEEKKLPKNAYRIKRQK